MTASHYVELPGDYRYGSRGCGSYLSPRKCAARRVGAALLVDAWMVALSLGRDTATPPRRPCSSYRPRRRWIRDVVVTEPAAYAVLVNTGAVPAEAPVTAEPIPQLVAPIEAASTYLSASVVFADEMRAILHDRGDVSDADLVDRIDAAYDRYWHARRARPAVADA